MSSSRVNRQARRKKAREQKQLLEQLAVKAEREEERYLEMLEDELEEDIDTEDDADVKEKSYYGDATPDYGMDMHSNPGPTTFEELDVERETREKVSKVNMLTYDAQDLVSNVLRSDEMQPDEKATKIKAVADGFASRVKDVMDTKIIKETLKENEPGILEGLKEYIDKAKLSSAARNKLPDSAFALPSKRKYPIHDKAHVRAALQRAAQMLKRGGEAAADAKAALPKIREAAKKFGIEMAEKAESGFIVEKDANGQHRVIMWPSNNFIDRDRDIISEAAHKEYVEWVNKNTDLMPVILAWHRPGTMLKNRVDYVDYADGFLFMSAPLEEDEATMLKSLSEKTELGMSHGSFALGRDPDDRRVITKYRMFEVSHLPLERAANPFTALDTLSKEAQMDIKEYLTDVFGGDEEKAEKYLKRTKEAQSTLQQAGVEDKEATAEVEAETTETPDVKAIIAKVGEEYDMAGLSEYIEKIEQGTKEANEKIELLTTLVKDLTKTKEEQVAEMISGNAGKRFAWQEKQESVKKDSELDEDNPEDKKLMDQAPGVPNPEDWLSVATGTQPIPNPS